MATLQRSGTVTLVFTDAEGSTRLLDGLGPEGYRNALGEHQRTVRDAFRRHGGYEVDNAGDGCFYAFPTAVGAAHAVGETLAALDGGRVQIRVGIHTGEPIARTAPACRWPVTRVLHRPSRRLARASSVLRRVDQQGGNS